MKIINNQIKSFSKDEKSAAHNISTLEYLSRVYGFTFKKTGNEYKCIQHNSLVVNLNQKTWFWNSKGFGGGDVIEFVRKVENESYPSAIEIVLHNMGNLSLTVIENNFTPSEKERPKELILPAKTDGKYAKAFAYLCKTRCIDKNIVIDLMKNNRIYQDVRNNVVFVGCDEEGTAKFACLRSTNTNSKFRGDCPGSDKLVGFALNSTSAKFHSKLYVFESPIDLLSHATLANIYLKNPDAYKNHNRLSLCGTADVALEEYLKKNPCIREIVFCLDNDTAGIKNATAYKTKYQELGYITTLSFPRGKDYNDDLCARVATNQANIATSSPPLRR